MLLSRQTRVKSLQGSLHGHKPPADPRQPGAPQSRRFSPEQASQLSEEVIVWFAGEQCQFTSKANETTYLQVPINRPRYDLVLGGIHGCCV